MLVKLSSDLVGKGWVGVSDHRSRWGLLRQRSKKEKQSPDPEETGQGRDAVRKGGEGSSL